LPDGYFGQQGIGDIGDEYNVVRFLIRQEIAKIRTGVPVKVVAVHGGGVGPAPTVDLQILVNQTDGQGNKTDHGIVYGIPVSRNQGSSYAVINDPHVGDVGHMMIQDRDMSAVKANDGAQSNPGSFRRHSMSDGVYVGAMLNPAVPTQYVQFHDDGVTVADHNGNIVEMRGGMVKITTAELHVTGDVTAGDGAVSLLHHLHSGVTPGGGDTGAPVGGS